ncbi:MAG: 3-deoxy-8-phosphooctulonate synthase [Deltaproteobacteria bacterium]|nr:3-deoxy-8-phosphooctulonate synthase [Deltaproteobacteria bacterium]MBW2018466.1 3-deoxy-8-phosphooctulonate synthase [Deltaproteobacteria bacterium]MBW2074123.1 3-deoxy-8-phosphooctulonate synthase [Deltaproteobacteria bacterium]RLB83665.1 MAG: 3-deoxy-8-phosphooctulonate synthase [Deltaproteobacteria bacterium]
MVNVGEIAIGEGNPLILIAGPCVIETLDATMEAATFLKDLTDELEIPFIFKTSYDKANRTSLRSYRGPGLSKGLEIISAVKSKLGIRVMSDVHRFREIVPAAQVLDILQVPAFLCRQTDFILAVSEAGKPVNIKKGQFLAPWDVAHVIEKVVSTGIRQVLVTERGTTFGYNNLVVDFRGLSIMRDLGWPVIFDATHSVQLPGGAGKSSGGQREFVPLMARAATAAGVDGIFLEVHKDPECALCDGPNSLPLQGVRPVLKQLKAIRQALLSTD